MSFSSTRRVRSFTAFEDDSEAGCVAAVCGTVSALPRSANSFLVINKKPDLESGLEAGYCYAGRSREKTFREFKRERKYSA